MPYDSDGILVHERVQTVTSGPSLTKQSDALASDVNSIVARHVAHRVPLPNGEGVHYAYGDFTGVSDFHGAMNRVKEAEASFMLLPANVRKYFKNDPGLFLEACYDGNRTAELEQLGVLDVQVPKDVPREEPRGDDQGPTS